MSEVHVITTGGRQMRIVCHVPVPAGNNSAGVSWQTALVNSGIGGTTVMKDGDGTAGTISAAEKTSLTTGAIFEVIVPMDLGNDFDGLSAAAKNARVDAAFNAAKAELQTRLQSDLKYFGFTRVVP